MFLNTAALVLLFSSCLGNGFLPSGEKKTGTDQSRAIKTEDITWEESLRLKDAS